MSKIVTRGSKFISRLLGRMLVKYKGLGFIDFVCKNVGHFNYAFENIDFDMARNGELRVIKLMGIMKPKCVFDVGANKGEWSHLIASYYPNSNIHAFEIVPLTFNELKRNLKTFSNVHLNDFGLGDANSYVDIFDLGEKFCCKATAFPLKSSNEDVAYYKNVTSCKVKKASDYISCNKIDAIDFVKLDVEGMEYKVLKGFEGDIEKARAVQFEHGVFNIASRFFFLIFLIFLVKKDS